MNSRLLAGSLVVAMLGANLVDCGGDLAIGADGDGSAGDAAGGGGGIDSSGNLFSGSSGGSGGSGSSGGSSNGGSSGSSGGSSDGGGGYEASTDGSVDDAISATDLGDGAITDSSFDVPPAPTGLAGFAFVVNGSTQTPLVCPATDWEFPPVAGQTGCTGEPPCPGIQSAYIVNTGTLPMPYIAQSYWGTQGIYSPGVPTGDSYQLTGVLGPGQQVDITSVYVGGITAVLGSSEPFSSPDGGKTAGDEGIIPWPPNVAGSGGATQMYVAEIEVYPSCQSVFHAW